MIAMGPLGLAFQGELLIFYEGALEAEGLESSW